MLGLLALNDHYNQNSGYFTERHVILLCNNHNINYRLSLIYSQEMQICSWLLISIEVCISFANYNYCLQMILVSITYCGYIVAVVVYIAGSVIVEQGSMSETSNHLSLFLAFVHPKLDFVFC